MITSLQKVWTARDFMKRGRSRPRPHLQSFVNVEEGVDKRTLLFGDHCASVLQQFVRVYHSRAKEVHDPV